VHRLDKDTSGLLVVAKNDAAHHGLAAQFEGHTLARVYYAFAWGLPKQTEGTIEGAIGRSTGNRKKMALIHGMNEKSHTGNFYGYREEWSGKEKPERSDRGKHAITHYTVTEAYGTVASKIECRLETGRTHQIRVHLSHLGHSVIGDPLYGKATGMKNHAAMKKLPEEKRDYILNFPRQALHAAELSFVHPSTGKQRHFTSKLPEDLKILQKYLKAIA
jgi:23S rRNA pseudouridine1911/1915/1917 synthase